MKEIMDNGWARSLFLVTNGFTDLHLKDTAIAPGSGGHNAQHGYMPA